MIARRHALVARIFLVIYLLLLFIPLVLVLIWAFTDAWPWPGLWPADFSLRGWREIFTGTDAVTGTLFWSIAIAVAVSIITTVIATMAARALCHHDFAGRELFRFATVLPFLIPSTVFAMGIQVFFLRTGLADTVPGVILAHSIVALPYAVTIMCDVTAAVGMRMEEAAICSGACRLRAFFEVGLPLLLPGVLSALSMSYIISFSQYFLTLIIGGGTVTTLAVVMFPFLTAGDRTVAAAYAVTFLAVTFGVFLVFEAILKYLGMEEQHNLYE